MLCFSPLFFTAFGRTDKSSWGHQSEKVMSSISDGSLRQDLLFPVSAQGAEFHIKTRVSSSAYSLCGLFGRGPEVTAETCFVM